MNANNNHKSSEDVIISINPATLEPVGQTKAYHSKDLPDLISKVRKAQQKWALVSLSKRIEYIKKIDFLVRENIDEIAKIISKETGKPLFESYASDIFSGLGSSKFIRQHAKRLLKPDKPKIGLFRLLRHSSIIHYDPKGVIGIISPWNFPWGIPYSQVVTALAAGNGVLLKPSSETPLTAMKLQEILREAGIPSNLVIVIPGSGSEVGKALAESSIDHLIFTGSTFIGSKIMEYAASNLTPVTLELGGKDPVIVLEDVDLENITTGLTWASFVNAGQVCGSAKRIYVPQQLYKPFLDKFKEKVSQLKLGWYAIDPDTTTGPIINEHELKKIERAVQDAKKQGAKILTGGHRTLGDQGYFFEPTVIFDVNHTFDIAKEEIFGPVVVVMAYDNEEEAVNLANDSPYGLTGSVWTQNIPKGQKIARKINSGTVAVNNQTMTYAIGATPWGGPGKSGIGRSHGELGLLEMVEPHHIYTDKRLFKKDPWWHPYHDETGLEFVKHLIDVVILSKWRKIGKLIRKYLFLQKNKI